MLDGADSTDPRWLADVRETLATASGMVVLRHLETVTPVALRALAAALPGTAARGEAWVAVCVRGGEPSPALAALLQLFPRTVQVPAHPPRERRDQADPGRGGLTLPEPDRAQTVVATAHSVRGDEPGRRRARAGRAAPGGAAPAGAAPGPTSLRTGRVRPAGARSDKDVAAPRPPGPGARLRRSS